jgi:hypothetical protein
MLVLIAQLPMAGRAEAPRVVVLAELGKDSPYALRFSVQSLGQEPVRLYTSDLPWGNVSSTVLVAVTVGGQRLAREAPIDDPDVATTQLQPGDTVTGVVDLRKAFPRLADLAATEEVLVFWSYRLTTTSGERTARTGGGCAFYKSSGQCWNDTQRQ